MQHLTHTAACTKKVIENECNQAPLKKKKIYSQGDTFNNDNISKIKVFFAYKLSGICLHLSSIDNMKSILLPQKRQAQWEFCMSY